MSQLAAEGAADEARKHAGTVIEMAGRLGYATKGTIYVIVGALATMAAWGAGGDTTDTHGAVAAIGDQFLGDLLLWIVAIGLGAYCFWRFIEALADPERRGSGLKGPLLRSGYIISGIFYGFLGWEAAAHQVHGESDAHRGVTANLMAWPGGLWIVAAIGLVVLGYGVYQIWQSYTGRFMRQFQNAQLDPHAERIALYSGRFGLAARGLLFGLVGIFIIIAAMRADPGETIGIGDALDLVAAQPLGAWLLLSVALGLVAYGTYCLVRARYRRFAVRQLNS